MTLCVCLEQCQRLSPWSTLLIGDMCNLADLLSRGVQPDVLLNEELWWKGPLWLSLEPSQWPRRPDINFGRELPEMRPTVYQIVVPGEEIGQNISTFNPPTTNLI